MNPRDLALDHTLDAEARNTLILVGLAVGVLVLATIVFYLWKKLRETSQEPIDEEKPQVPHNMPGPESFRFEHPINTDTNKNSRRSRLAAVFGPTSIRKQLTMPLSKHNIQVYRGSNGVHVLTNHSPGFSTAASHSEGRVSPHLVGWMTLADSVVGQHPHVRPLHDRIATQAEIDMISGHVHIPWAHKSDPRLPQPTAVKVQKPVVLHPAVPPPVHAKPLQDNGNAHRKCVSTSTSEIALEKRSPKSKSGRRVREKENMLQTVASGSNRNRRW